MHPMRRMEMIRSAFPDGEDGAAEIRAAARVLERRASIGEVLGALAEPGFPAALLGAAELCASVEEEAAWLTLATAGARRARQALAWRASQLLDAGQLAAASTRSGRARRQALRRFAAGSGAPEAAAAWRLIAHLRAGELRRLVAARPVLAAAERRVRASRGVMEASAPCPALG